MTPMRKKPSEKNFEIKKECRVCGNALGKKDVVIRLPDQPLANNLESKPNAGDYYPLYLSLCHKCHHLQLPVVVKPKILFGNYLYKSSISEVFIKHFYDLAKKIKSFRPKLVVDIGSNDGVLIHPLAKMGVTAIGIDPAEKLQTEGKGIQIQGWFETQEIADGILNYYGQADIITACNSFAHISDLHGVIRNVRRLLKPGGRFIIEVQHLLPLLQNNYFDMIYHEHLSYYSLISLRELFDIYGMAIVDVEKIPTHGGSIRVYVQRVPDVKRIHKRVDKLVEEEIRYGLTSSKTFVGFGKNIKDTENKVRLLLSKCKGSLYGYGAPAKATVLMHTLGIKSLSFQIFDDNILKQGKYIPGTGNKVIALGQVSDDATIIIFAWNFADSIIQKLRQKGYKGKFLVPLPEPKII